MPSVTVTVPTLLRVDPRCLRDGRRELADALGAATTRAVASASIALPGATRVAASPTFSWTGDGAGEVDGGTRSEIEALCREQIARALGAATTVGGEEAPVPTSPRLVPAAAAEPGSTPTRHFPPRAATGGTHTTATPAAVERPVELGGIPVALPSERLEDIETLVESALAAEQERDSQPHTCDPFFDEPSILDLGPISHELRRRIAEIADLLEIEDPCPYGGAFLMTSGDVLLLRVLDIGLADVVEAGTNVATGPGGTEVLFRPSSSVQVEALQILASVVPLLTALTQLLEQVPEGMPLGWAPALHERLDPQLDEVVATLFRLTCRVLFLPVLNASRIAIETRRADPAFEQFAELFAAAVTRPRSEIAELVELRDRLAGGVPASPAQRATTWREALLEVDSLLAGRRTFESEIVEDAGVWRVRDRSGRSWTFEELETAISARRAAKASADPLVNQLALLPEVDARFRIPDAAVPGELRRLLDELYTIVVEQTLHAEADPDLGFAWGRVVPEDGMAMVPYTIYLLQGLHLLAHELLSDDFADDFFYPRGVNLLFGSELGARALAGPGELGELVKTALVAASPVEVPSRLLRSSGSAELDEDAGMVDGEALRAATASERTLFAEELAGYEDAPGRLDAVVALREELNARYDAALAASGGALRPGLRHEVRELAGRLVRELDELDRLPEPASTVTQPAAETAEPGESEPSWERAEAESETAAPPELTFRPDGIAGVTDGYVMVEPASGWAPGGLDAYTSPEGRQHLRLGLEARARFTLGLPGCRGWRCASGGRRLDAIAAAVLDELRADAPELADRVEFGGRG
jgi:hypothetical protein